MDWIYPAASAIKTKTGKYYCKKMLKQLTFQSLADLAEKAPEAAYIIPFLNVYAAPNADDYLIVDVNGGYHKAILSENIKDSDTIFDFKGTEKPINGSFENQSGKCDTAPLWRGGLSSNG